MCSLPLLGLQLYWNMVRPPSSNIYRAPQSCTLQKIHQHLIKTQPYESYAVQVQRPINKPAILNVQFASRQASAR